MIFARIPARIAALAVGVAMLPATSERARAQHVNPPPPRPIRSIMPYSPGGAFDNIARIVISQVSESLEQTIVMGHRPVRVQ